MVGGPGGGGRRERYFEVAGGQLVGWGDGGGRDSVGGDVGSGILVAR